MNYIIIVRNPSSHQIMAIQEGENIAMFETYEAAEECAEDQTLCVAWGYQIVDAEV
jgi:hypothetical protein